MDNDDIFRRTAATAAVPPRRRPQPGTVDVAGPGEALALAIAGRPVALADLDGDGVPVLQERLAG